MSLMIITPVQASTIPSIPRQDLFQLIKNRLLLIVPGHLLHSDQIFMLHAGSPDA